MTKRLELLDFVLALCHDKSIIVPILQMRKIEVQKGK